MADTFVCERCASMGIAFDDYGQWLCEKCFADEDAPALRRDTTDPQDEEA